VLEIRKHGANFLMNNLLRSRCFCRRKSSVKHDCRQQNGPGGAVSASWSLTSPIRTKFLRAW